MTNSVEFFEKAVARAWPPAEWSGAPVIVAVSGGADSVALLRATAAIRGAGQGRIVAAHYNHAIRGAESDADEAFVRDLAGKLGLDFLSERAADGAAGDSASEESLRNLRHAFLKRAAEAAVARHVATAHTADDQAETILHRILRGTSIAGLAGIPAAREFRYGVSLVRPMLAIRREEAREYLRALGQEWREDASNLDSAWTRNRIRNELIPQLVRDFNPQVVEALARLGQNAREAQEVVAVSAGELFSKAIFRDDGAIEFDAASFAGANRHVVREALVLAWEKQNWPRGTLGFEHLDALADLALGEADGQFDLPGGVRAQKKGARFILARLWK